MVYTPTPTQSKQDKAMVAFIEALNQNLCLSEQASSCAIRGGSRTRGKGTTRGRKTSKGSDSDDSTTSNADRKTKKTSKKATPIRVKAARECEDEEEWEQYMNISRVFIITGTVGAGAMAMLGVFSGYADSVMETLGYGNVERTCAAGNYLANTYAATLVPGMKTCAQVTQQQETMMKGVWAAIVALAAAFKLSVPTSISETPGAAITGFAKVLCRYFKERELHNELLQNIAKNTKGISQDDVNRAVAEALAAHQSQVVAGLQPTASPSPKGSPQDSLRNISVGRNAQKTDATARSRRRTGIQSAPVVQERTGNKSRTPTPTSPNYPHTLPSTPGSDMEEGEESEESEEEESDEGGVAHKKKQTRTKKSPPKKRATRRSKRGKSGGKKAKKPKRKTKAKPKKKSRGHKKSRKQKK